jgi:hypothetical protein
MIFHCKLSQERYGSSSWSAQRSPLIFIAFTVDQRQPEYAPSSTRLHNNWEGQIYEEACNALQDANRTVYVLQGGFIQFGELYKVMLHCSS